MLLQQLLLNGENGAIGPNAQPLVARGPELGAVGAVIQLLGATSSVLEIQRKLKNARHLSAQVNHCVSYH